MGLSEWWGRALGTPVDEARKKKDGPATGPPKNIARAGFEFGIPPSGLREWSTALPGSTGSDRRTELQELHEVYLQCPWAWAGVNAIARRVTAGPLEFTWTAPDGDGDAEQPKKPAQVQACERLFAFCNERENLRQILRGAITDLLVYGDAFLEVVWVGKVPVALYSLDCPSTMPLADDHGRITGYVQRTDYGQRADFDPHQVIHLSLDSPRSGVFGVSPVKAALSPIQRWLFAAATQLQTYRRGDPMRLHVDLPAHMSAGSIKKWIEMFLATNVGPDNVANPVVTKNGGVVNELQRGAIGSGLEAMSTARDEILSALGVPPAQAGVIESGNLGGGTGDSQDKSFQVQTCDPLAAIVIDKIHYQLAQRGFDVPDGWTLQFAEVDLRDSKVIEDIREQRFRHGVYTLNDWRSDIGMSRVDGGDEPLILVAQGTVARVRDLEASALAGIAKQVQGTTLEIADLGGEDNPVTLAIIEPKQPDEDPGSSDDSGDDWADDEDDDEDDEAWGSGPPDETAHPDEDDLAEARRVRSAAGAKRYGVPIGSEITADAIRKSKTRPGGGKAAPTKPHRGPRSTASRPVTDTERSQVNEMMGGFTPPAIRDDRAATAYLTKNAPKLPRDQRDAVNRYTGDTFLDLNKRLRGGDDSDPEVKRLDAAMRPLGEDLVLTRHVRPEAFGLTGKTLAGGIEGMRGKVVTEHAYMSTALGSPYGGGVGDVTMRLAVPKGTPAVAASALSSNPHEREVLLGRGVRIAIAKVEKNDRGGWTVTGVVIPEGADDEEGGKAA